MHPTRVKVWLLGPGVYSSPLSHVYTSTWGGFVPTGMDMHFESPICHLFTHDSPPPYVSCCLSQRAMTVSLVFLELLRERGTQSSSYTVDHCNCARTDWVSLCP